MATKAKKPPTEKVLRPSLEIFSIREPIDEIEIKDAAGKVIRKEWRYATYHYTTADAPVTYMGIQYIPLSCFDQVRWESKMKEVTG